MPLPDEVRLRHMLDAAREVERFVAGKARVDLDTDRLLTLALLKSLEMIGEAASRVSEEVRTRHDGIPWVRIVGMRNRLIHAYFDVDLDQVWLTVTRDLPELRKALDEILAS